MKHFFSLIIITIVNYGALFAQVPVLQPITIPGAGGGQQTTSQVAVSPPPPMWQSNQGNTINYKNVNYNVFMVKVDSSTVKKFSIIENNAKVPNVDFIKSQTGKYPNTFLINGGFYDKNGKPVGYYVNNGQKLQDINPSTNGDGAFFMQPNGAFILTNNDAIICETNQIANTQYVFLGLQNGPLLVDNGIINGNLGPNSTNKLLRCGVGIGSFSNDKYIVFAFSNSVINYFQLASLFKEYYNCNNALLLHNAGNAIYYPGENNPNAGFNQVISTYISYQY